LPAARMSASGIAPVSPSMIMFIAGTMLGNLALAVTYFLAPSPFLAVLIGQVFLCVYFAWYLAQLPTPLAITGAAIAAITAVVLMVFCFAALYQNFGVVNTVTLKETHDPATCLYFSLITLTAVGFGDFVPSQAARLYAGCEALFSYVVLGAFIAIFVRIFGLFLPPNTR
jgi:hypothetical protein